MLVFVRKEKYFKLMEDFKRTNTLLFLQIRQTFRHLWKQSSLNLHKLHVNTFLIFLIHK